MSFSRRFIWFIWWKNINMLVSTNLEISKKLPHRMEAEPSLTKSCWAWWGRWGRTRQRTSCSTWSLRSTSTATARLNFQSSWNWWSRRPRRCGNLDSNLILSDQLFSSFSFFFGNNVGEASLALIPCCICCRTTMQTQFGRLSRSSIETRMASSALRSWKRWTMLSIKST